MSERPIIKVLFIEDDEEDFLLTNDLLREVRTARYELDWVRTGEAGLQAALANRHDVCLLDYRLGDRDGLELLRDAIAGGCQMPIIMLTGLGRPEVDEAAMRAGAADYLVKNGLQAAELERTIRYAIERKRAAARAAFEQARLAAFGAEVGRNLTQPDPLDAILERCAGAMVQYLNAALAQIWVYDSQTRQWLPRAQAGPLHDPHALLGDTPTVVLDVEALARGEPVLINRLAEDPRFNKPGWARASGVVALAAQPLILENRLVGLMTLYSTAPLTEQTLQEMASVAHGVALCIGHKQAEIAYQLCNRRYQSVVENLGEIVFQTDPTGRWTYLNPAWERVTGFSVRQALGAPILDYILEEDRASCARAFADLIARRADTCRRITRFQLRDGSVRRMEVYAQLLMNPDGTVLGAAGSIREAGTPAPAPAESVGETPRPSATPELVSA
ncbi:MAG: PAS domain-containing protein [Verrucomicrobiae bacterium]|nr:PAS domain-containing protein [Verrucomicrobiae bacterium]